MSGENLDYDIDDEEDDLFEDAIEGELEQDQDQDTDQGRGQDQDQDQDQDQEMDIDRDEDTVGSTAIDENYEEDEKDDVPDASSDERIVPNTGGDENELTIKQETDSVDGSSRQTLGHEVGGQTNGLGHSQYHESGNGHEDTESDMIVGFDGNKRHKTFREKYPIEPSHELMDCSSYDIVPYVAAIHGCPVHSLAFSWGMKWMFTGGQDGFIRKYNFMDSVNGKAPLTVAQRHQFVDSITKSGVLTSYWENEQPVFQKLAKVGSDGLYEPILSPVYSMAVQSEALWLLAGLESGGITLQSVRHNEGQIHAYLDKHTSAVSCIRLDDSETIALSGSWDKTVVEWDLNTGKAIHQYIGASGQISSLEWQPNGGAIVSNALRDEVERFKNRAKAPTSGSSTNGNFGPTKQNIKTENGDGNSSGSPSRNDEEDEDDRKSLGSLFGDDDEEENEENPMGSSPIVKKEDTTGNENENSDNTANLNDKDKTDNRRNNENDNEENSESKDNTADNDNDDNRNGINDGGTGSGNNSSPLLTTNSGYAMFMTSSIDGTIDIWDRRQRTRAAHIRVPESTPPWCMSACWSTDGNFIFAGRRNSTVDEFDIRASLVSPSRTFKFPSVSGAVSSVCALPNNRHLLCGSHDNVRLYDLNMSQAKRKMPFFIIPGHHGAVISSMYVDPGCNYMVSASGSRGWQGNSTDVALVYEIRPM
ncbi:SAGA complex subunit SPT8 [Sugiyamaella lignohabitans]|uniref:SAGA complex subunit SPT8 n=1 Tax=Sugiyamaella lignohabitans TaxID=796027 RepID=A0A167DNC8_9ASCO|nr:SAGA complex subunit SPT8 [Sugiyamaella lignohabitans]ANB13100.1 SAGA complex subunit SPT8 [Sugiyamaella lignohabitans]